MKNCIGCDNMLSEDATYCYVCNTAQTAGFNEFEAKPKPDATFLKILCAFIVAATLIHFISLPASWITMAGMPDTDPTIILGISTFVIIGKLTGAIFMLRKKLLGLHIYTGASVIGIVSSLVMTMKLTQYLNGMFSGLISFGIVLFPVLFLILYWLPVNRRVLS